ncbi:DMT family transporter [Glycomyces tritici]|uniref:SMR family transporter n=1 Tax=Glycomyces tritici TaxID=2665176 RepID=A0ABT7YTV5_9ACTN|nr:SMR family transporter [Glycomyces tritici]MDN3242076.1 SMR family transporter [Glycomyces tritici]
MTWLLLAGAIIAEVIATLSLRASEGMRRKRWIPAVVVGYLAAFGLLTLALAHGMGIGIAYGIWAACGVALTAVGARVFFKDRLTKRMGAGIALIAAGVLLIELGAAH